MKKLFVCICILVACFNITPSIYAQDLTWEDYNNIANNHHNAGYYTGAIENYTKAIVLNPNIYYLYTNRGTSEFKLGLYDEAREDFTKALSMNHFDPTAENYLKKIDKILNNSNNTNFQNNLQQPSNRDIAIQYFNTGTENIKKGNYKEASDNLNTAISLGLNNEETYFNLALAKIGLHDYRGALGIAIEIKKINPHSNRPKQILNCAKDAFILNANTKFNNKDYKGAADEYSHALAIDSNNSNLYEARGNAKFNLKDYNGAIEDYNSSATIKSPGINLYIFRGHSFFNLGNYKSAIANYTSAINLNSNNGDLYMFRGNAFYNLNDYDAAITDYNSAIKLNPDNKDLYVYRENAYNAKGKHSNTLDNDNTSFENKTENINTNTTSDGVKKEWGILIASFFIVYLLTYYKEKQQQQKEETRIQRVLMEQKEKEDAIKRQKEEEERRKAEAERQKAEEERQKQLAIERQKRSYWQKYWTEKQKNGFEFERAVGELYGKMGYKYEVINGTYNDCVDLVLYKDGTKTIVQCNSHNHVVGDSAVRALWDIREDHDAQKAIFIAYAVTGSAKDFIMGKDYKILSIKDLIELSLNAYSEKINN